MTDKKWSTKASAHWFEETMKFETDSPTCSRERVRL